MSVGDDNDDDEEEDSKEQQYIDKQNGIGDEEGSDAGRLTSAERDDSFFMYVLR